MEIAFPEAARSVPTLASDSAARHPATMSARGVYPGIAELMIRNGVGTREDFKRLGVRLPRRRRRLRPATPAARAYAEVQFHWTHLRGAFEEWKAVPTEPPTGDLTLAKILTMFMTAKVVAMDEAIQAFHATLRDDERGQEFVRAIRPLLKRARVHMPALKAMRSRWVAHGASQRQEVREPPPLAREHPGAPTNEAELAFVVAVYLQYFAISFVAMPEKLLLGVEYQRTSSEARRPPDGPTDEDCREWLSELSAGACGSLGLEELPILAYDRDAL